MAQDLSIESAEHTYLITTRTIGSKLWFVNNPELEKYVLSFLAKYQEKYEVILYAFIIMGNHYHLVASFPKANKSAFLQSFNSIFARLTSSRVEQFDGGRVWARRARTQILPRDEDIEHWSFYCALNSVSSGLLENHNEYSGYNSFFDNIYRNERKFKLVDWSDYNNRSRANKSLTTKDCTHTYTLKFSRLPGYDKLTNKQYKNRMLRSIEERRVATVQKRLAEGKGFASKETLLAVEPGTAPKSTKTSQRHTPRPLVLTLCMETKRACVDALFVIAATFKEASKKYRAGDFTAVFPCGTYRPVTRCLSTA